MIFPILHTYFKLSITPQGTYGRLGLGDSNNQQYLKHINTCDRPIIQVSSSKGSDGHTLALSKDGKIYSWGDG